MESQDMLLAYQFSGAVVWGRKLRKGTLASATTSLWEKVSPWLSPWCQTIQLLPVCLWCLSICCSHAGAQTEWVSVSLCRGPLRELPGNLAVSVFHSLDFYHQKVCAPIFLALKPWTGEPSVGVGPLTPEISLPIFIRHTRTFRISSAPTSLDVVSSLIP